MLPVSPELFSIARNLHICFLFMFFIIGPFMNFHLYFYQKSADFVRSWVYGVKLSNFENNYHCSPEKYFFFFEKWSS